MTEDDNQRNQVQLRRLRFVIIILSILCFALVTLVVVVYVTMDKELQERTLPTCATGSGSIHLDDPDQPSVFHELTRKEIEGLQHYLYSKDSLNLVRPSEAAINTSYIFTADLYLPRKRDVLGHLDNDDPSPPREATVVMFRGDKEIPVIEEYIVGPLPKPNYHKKLVRKGRTTPIPLEYAPVSGPIHVPIIGEVVAKADRILKDLLEESYGGTFTKCADKCLALRFHTIVPRVISGEDSRIIWFWGWHFVEFFVLNPVDLFISIKMVNTTFSIHQVTYNEQTFSSFEDLISKYRNGSVQKSRIPFPVVNNNHFSTLNRRGPASSSKPSRPPRQIEPDGKRYSINGRREISVFYSGDTPLLKFANFLDSIGLIGASSNSLVPGSDCPVIATFIDFSYLSEDSFEITTKKNTFCIFEFDTGVPLRRHHSYYEFLGRVYEGMSDVVLVLRTIASIANYDYIFDFIFHQNGALEVKVMLTGLIASTPHSSLDQRHGFRLHDRISGPLHHHMFHFKADLDMKGTNNRFETIDISEEKVPKGGWSKNPDNIHSQTKISRSLKRTELEAAYKFNFSSPTYTLFTNDKMKSKYGNSKGYRLMLRGMSKQLIQENIGNEPIVSWARYQIAVTKQKDNERESSSMYSCWDAVDPVVRFQHFLDDDEDIVDQDLVAWISLGTHHIPRTEDLPTVTTAGMSLDFILLPFNYFDEDPAMSSMNAIRIDAFDKDGKKIGIERYGVTSDLKCVPEKSSFDVDLKNDPDSLFSYS